MKPKLIDFCSSGDDKVFSFEEYNNYLEALRKWTIENSKEFIVTDIQLQDMKQISIGNIKTNKVILWFNTMDLDYNYLIKLANEICDKLNSENEKK